MRKGNVGLRQMNTKAPCCIAVDHTAACACRAACKVQSSVERRALKQPGSALAGPGCACCSAAVAGCMCSMACRHPTLLNELLSAGATWPRGSSSVKLRSAQTGQWSLPSHSGQMSAPVSLSSTVSCSREGHKSSPEAVHCQPHTSLILPCRNQQMAVEATWLPHTAARCPRPIEALRMCTVQ